MTSLLPARVVALSTSIVPSTITHLILEKAAHANTVKVPFCSWAVAFPHLQELSIDGCVEHLADLPSSLCKLALRSYDDHANFNVAHTYMEAYQHGLQELDLGVELSSTNKWILQKCQKTLESLPPLKKLSFFSWNGLNLDILPETLRSLRVTGNYAGTLDYLPQLTTLVISAPNFNSRIDNLPASLTCLELGNGFNQHVDSLPSSLKELKLRGTFNLSVDRLPSGLRILHLSKDFNQPVDYLPDGLTILVLGDLFNLPVDNLPLGLRELFVRSLMFDQPVDHLPPNLVTLHLGPTFNRWTDHLPTTLTDVHMENELLTRRLKPNISSQRLCLRITQSKFVDIFADQSASLSLHLVRCTSPLQIPPTTTVLHIINSPLFADTLRALPTCLEDLTIDALLFNSVIPRSLVNLRRLSITSKKFNRAISTLPSLRELKISSDEFDQPLASLPPSLHRLTLVSAAFNHPFPEHLLELRYLQLKSNAFVHALGPLPPLIRVLHVETRSPNIVLPPNLEHVFIKSHSMTFGPSTNLCDFFISAGKRESNLLGCVCSHATCDVRHTM